MKQLIMRWKNDGKVLPDLQIPENCRITNFTELDNAVDKWLDIQFGLANGRQNKEAYASTMLSHANYEENKCFFILENEQAVATLTVICDYDKKEGYIHMVACQEAFRGKGYGTLLNKIALHTLKNEEMQTAYLTTDDWRIPAIKSYLRAGFEPDISTEDFKERWSKVFKEIDK